MKELVNNWKIIILLCVAIGMAPFYPEPHIWGKIKWISGGAVGMQPQDWFDLFFHGFPFLLLLRLIFTKNNSGLENRN
ncbi:hypothetical protein SAMN05421636_108122 [Pricia antarctica]|uniref:RND transporter n=1 Tax=Pricia antarctica TaxID=641691 RepID=A0A1G7GFN8_9FLAO|nr:hypothetical protein [Pricia antarctica]SDE86958.1 hypothetical protein SAMN05421636_108122 [Pricia antarctica]